MATIPYREPVFVGNPRHVEPYPVLVNPAQNAVWRRGDILVEATTGAIVLPQSNGAGTGTGIAGPTSAVITATTSASAGAPAATYFVQVAYNVTNHTNESIPSALFEINCPPGFLPSVNVAAAGAPFSATNYQVYMGLLPTYLANQNGAAGTALGTPFVAANPLADYAGAQRGATNLNTNVLGMAICASNENYFDGYGGSFTAGNPGSRLGSTNTIDPLTPTEAPLGYVIALGAGTQIEMNLNTASGGFSPLLIGTTAGLTLDAASGWFTADTSQSNKILTIVGYRPGVYIGPTAQGNPGDLGARVVVQFTTASALLIQ